MASLCVCGEGDMGVAAVFKWWDAKQLYETIGAEGNYDATWNKSKMYLAADITSHDIADSSEIFSTCIHVFRGTKLNLIRSYMYIT